MKTQRMGVAVAGAMVLALLLVSPVHADRARDHVTGKVYSMENDPEQNRIAVFARFVSGRLKRIGSVRTGGLGAGDNAAADPLGGQNAMLLSEDRDTLYVVNAGSDDISVFDVSRFGWPRLVQRISSEGVFPVSLTSDGGTLYVLNAGGDGSIAGFRQTRRGRLRLIPDSVRTLGLGLVGPPIGDARNLAPGDIGFDTLNRRLLITHAGGGSAGELLSFPVQDDGTPGNQPEVVQSEGAVPFSLDFSPNGTALVAEASGSVSSYNYGLGADLAVVSSAVANGQAATCWVQSSASGLVVVSNTVSGTLSTYEVSRNGVLTLLDAAAASGIGEPVDFSFTPNERFLYVVASSEGGIRGFRVRRSGRLRDLGLFQGLPTFAQDGFAPQGLVVR